MALVISRIVLTTFSYSGLGVGSIRGSIRKLRCSADDEGVALAMGAFATHQTAFAFRFRYFSAKAKSICCLSSSGPER